jgi:Xaa-Pro aminopeptidase
MNMKIKRLQKLLIENRLDAAVLSNFFAKDPNFFCFTGLAPEDSFLIIPKKGNSVFLTSSLEAERAKKLSGIKDVRKFQRPVYRSLAKAVGRAKKIGINMSIVPVNEHKHMKKTMAGRQFHDISGLLSHLRRQKDPDEIEKLMKACSIADSIFSGIVKDFKWKTEEDIRKYIISEANRLGNGVSFEPIVASGKMASMPHYAGSNAPIRKGFMVIDFGVDYEGYKSDITRTIYVGKPSASDISLYNMLLAAQGEAVNSAEAGVSVAGLMEKVQKRLGRYKKNFIHSLGHGIGVEIHEGPGLSMNSKEVLAEGDVFTIEPGIYLKGKLGIRIEDDIMVKGGKPVILTKSKRELITV